MALIEQGQKCAYIPSRELFRLLTKETGSLLRWHLLRTHTLTTGDRYVNVAFHQKGGSHKGQQRVRAPKLSAQAVPGIYLLFVVDEAGVPGVAKRLYLITEK